MAEKATGNKPKKKAAKDDAAGVGHNSEKDKKKLDAHVQRIMGKMDNMEKDHGGHILEIAFDIEKASEDTGFSKGLIRSEIATIRRKKKQEAKEKGMSESERADTERFRSLMGDTPMGKWVGGALAAPAEV